MTRLTISAIALAAAGAAPVAAQNAIDAGKIDLQSWNYTDIYSGNGWSVVDMFDEGVYDESGERIGDVEDFVVNNDGEVIALVAEVGGFWDIGDTHVGVPLDEVDMSSARITVPVTEDTVDDYDLFEYSGLPGTTLGEEVTTGLDDTTFAMGTWRASDLIGDYVRIRDDDGENWLNYGYVNDLVVSDGEIASTIVNTAGSYGQGSYAYPYYAPRDYGAMYDMPAGRWDAGAPTYDLPYLEGEVTDLPEFEYEQMGEG